MRSHKPITAIVFLTDRCNNKCSYCRFRHNKTEDMNPEHFARYIDKMQRMGVVGVVLSGGGEPLMAEDFDMITGQLDIAKMPFGINTNGTIYRSIRRHYARYVKVSIDASSSEEYLKKRGTHLYGKVLENVERWCEERYDDTRIGIQCVIEKPGDATRFYEAHESLKVDYLSMRPIEARNVKYSSSDLAKIINELVELKREDGRVAINYKWTYVRSERCAECSGHWAYLTVTPQGNVIYCCHKPDEVVGNIMDEDIEEKIAGFRTDMSTCEWPCILTGTNKYIERYKEREHWQFL